MLKRVRISRQYSYTYTDQSFWSTWGGMMNTSGFINALRGGSQLLKRR